MLITKAINFLLEREQLSNCLPLGRFSIFRLQIFSRKTSFLRKSAALFPHLQLAQALNGKIENDFLTLLVENYCQGMGQVSPVKASDWSIIPDSWFSLAGIISVHTRSNALIFSDWILCSAPTYTRSKNEVILRRSSEFFYVSNAVLENNWRD